MHTTEAVPTHNAQHRIHENTEFPDAPYPLAAALFDIDGTLVGANHAIALRTKRAVEALRTTGVTLGLATGRASFATEEVSRALGIVGPSMFFAGSLIQDLSTGKTLYQVELTPSAIDELLTLSANNGYHVELYSDTDFYAERMTEDLVIHQQYCPKPAKLAPLHQVMCDHTVIKSVIMTTVGAGEEKLRKELAAVSGIAVTYSYGAVHADIVFANIVDAKATRTAAFNELLKINGCTPAQVATFGDAEADCEFLNLARFGVAMANASDRVKSCASYVTTSVDEGGVGLAIEKLFLGA
jgi:Cof subfamily protein (haloacid dehalogenase superfamily)